MHAHEAAKIKGQEGRRPLSGPTADAGGEPCDSALAQRDESEELLDVLV